MGVEEGLSYGRLLEKLREEKEIIAQQIKSVSIIRTGRIRSFSDDKEKARQSVTQAIRRALKKIKKTHENLWYHLEDALSIKTDCKYAPPSHINWFI